MTGFQTGSGAGFKRFRIDYDNAGPHYNVEIGKGADAQHFRIDFDGTEADVLKMMDRLSRDAELKGLTIAE